MSSSGLNVCVGISGGIAAYKVPALVRLLRGRGCAVKTVLTPAARELVGSEALRAVSGSEVYTDGEYRYDMDHIRLAQWADCLLICPATANTIAKLALGLADTVLSTLALSFAGRIVVVPAMNTVMWNNEATVRNVATLAARTSVEVLPVDCGPLACGDEGAGRMIPLEQIVDHVLCPPVRPILKGKRFLISSGPTREAIDPVRVLTNRSSGKMGSAPAAAAAAMGANVTVVGGPATAPLPGGVRSVIVESARDMAAALKKEFPSCDVCIMAAAVSDFRADKPARAKIDRRGAQTVSLALVPNPDIIADLGARKSKQFLVGFSLESNTTAGEKRAREKMKRKNADMIILNTVSSTLDADETSAVCLCRNTRRRERVLRMSKPAAAREMCRLIATHAGFDS